MIRQTMIQLCTGQYTGKFTHIKMKLLIFHKITLLLIRANPSNDSVNGNWIDSSVVFDMRAISVLRLFLCCGQNPITCNKL
jgi:hypothetical protein